MCTVHQYIKVGLSALKFVGFTDLSYADFRYYRASWNDILHCMLHRLTAGTTPTHAIASYPDTSSDIHLSLSTLILQTCRAWLKQLRQAPKHVSNTDHDASKALAHRTVDVRLVQLV